MSINNPDLSDTKNISTVTNYNKTAQAINGGEWDYVVNFFEKNMSGPVTGGIKPQEYSVGGAPNLSYTKTATRPSNYKAAAESLALDIFQVAKQADVPVLEIIKSMDGQTGLELNISLSYYLNGIRSNTSLLGVSNVVKPNFYAGRSVLI